jgi:hypothetical protein
MFLLQEFSVSKTVISMWFLYFIERVFLAERPSIANPYGRAMVNEEFEG